MNANKKKRSLHTEKWITALLIILLAFWYYAPPRAYIYYSKYGEDEIIYLQHILLDTYEESILPGHSTFFLGQIFPNKEYSIKFDWWHKRTYNCIHIVPQWPKTTIYLNMSGNIDTYRTSPSDLARLKPCLGSKTKVSRD